MTGGISAATGAGRSRTEDSTRSWGRAFPLMDTTGPERMPGERFANSASGFSSAAISLRRVTLLIATSPSSGAATSITAASAGSCHRLRFHRTPDKVTGPPIAFRPELFPLSPKPVNAQNPVIHRS